MADSKKMPLPFPVEAKAAFRRLSQGSMTDSYGDCGARVKSPKDTYLRNQFTERCIDELDGDHYKTFVVNNPSGITLLRDVLVTAHWLCRLSRLSQGELSRDVFQQLFFILSSKCIDFR